MNRQTCLAGLVAISALLPVTAGADPQSLSDGRAHYLGARFAEAERAFETVVEDGSSSRAELLEALRYLAVLRLVRGDREAASEAAVQAVSLIPNASPPEGAPPDAGALFDSARGRVTRSGLSGRIAVPENPVAGSPARVRVEIVGDPGALVAAVTVNCGREHRLTPTHAETGGSQAEVSIDVPLGETRCSARFLSNSGVELVRTTASFVARASIENGEPLPDPIGPPVGPRERPGFPWLWVGLGSGAAVVAAVVTAIVLSSGSDEAVLGEVTIVER